jgi:magnesium-transporting ATPase (P-type)
VDQRTPSTVTADPSERAPWHALDPEEVRARLDAGPHGLPSDEAARRLERFGPNRLEETPPPGPLVVLLNQFRSPLVYILVVATVVTIALRDYVDAGVIAAVLALNAAIGFFQERNAERSVRSLMQLVAPHARVLRDGREWDLESREVVPGDVVLLESGSLVPADLRLSAAVNLSIDESLLTGESLPVTKSVVPVDRDAPLADRRTMAFTGSVVTSGRGRGYVVATGTATELGAIAEHVRTERRPQTPLQQRMSRFAKIVAIVIAAVSAIAFAVGVAIGLGVAEMFKVAVALAVSAIPEGLPVVFTIALALGVRRMARRKAIIRHLPAVETLGSTTVIGSDKTGTLTQNRMTVQEIWTAGKTVAVQDGDPALPELDDGLRDGNPVLLTLLAGVLTNEAEAYRTADGFDIQGDPTEAALLIAAARMGLEPDEVRSSFDLAAEVPFEPERRFSASAQVRGDHRLVVVKGAPERVLEMCDRMLTSKGPASMTPDQVHDAARAMAARGLRVLGMAYADDRGDALDQHVEDPSGLVFLGLQGMLDPPRPGVREAVAGCRSAGIRVVMITGDHAITAEAIGREVGLGDDDVGVMTGAELEDLSDDELRERVDDVDVYARVSPEHKLRVVRAFRSRGEVVAVTGDGVNDAPALKAADIGVAMGKSGTDVAREASDMVLADDDFVSIYAAVEEGRVAFDNLRKVTFFLISSGAAAVLTILAALLLGWPLPLLPAQILWLNLVTNGIQDVALAFEPGEREVLRRPPRPRREGVVSALLWERTVLAGIVMGIGALLMFRWQLDHGATVEHARVVTVTTIVLFQAFHAGNSRSEFRSVFAMSPFSNPLLLWGVVGALTIHLAAMYVPFTQFVLRFEPVPARTWAEMLAVAVTIVLAMEVHKLVRRGADPARRTS